MIAILEQITYKKNSYPSFMNGTLSNSDNFVRMTERFDNKSFLVLFRAMSTCIRKTIMEQNVSRDNNVYSNCLSTLSDDYQ